MNRATASGGKGDVRLVPAKGARCREERALRRALTNPVSLAHALGLAPGSRPQRDGLVVRCPSHKPDNHPSCSVRRLASGAVWFRCFACLVRGDALDLIATTFGLDRQRDVATVIAVARDLARSMPTASPAEATSPLPPETFNALARHLLALCPIQSEGRVAAYLHQRGVFEQALSAGWAEVPQEASAVAALVQELRAEFGSETWLRCGLGSKHCGLLHPGHRLIIPWRDARGRTTTLQRRLVDACYPGPRYVFPRGQGPDDLYGAEFGDDEGAVAFVEGAFDTLALRRLCTDGGVKRTVFGLPGATTWKRSWAARTRGRVVLIGTDDDTAGNQAANLIARDCRGAGATKVLRIKPGQAKDWAALLEAKS